MTIWDNIYKNYQKGGEAWATLSEEIHPLFKQFLDQSIFELKSALDIGCGTGKYLKILQAGGFKTSGIDSSETAVEMTKKEQWNTFKDHEKIAEGTSVPLSGPEKGLPHSFYTKEEVEKLFSNFKNVKLELDTIGRWVIQASK